MDIWMVAVAAGAGYIAQHFKKSKQIGEQITSESSLNDNPNSPKNPPDKKWPFRRSIKKDKSEVSATEVASTSEFDTVNGVIPSNCKGNNVFSSSTLFPGFANSDRVSENMGTPRSRMLLKNRRAIAIKPLTSLESCLMAQLQSPFASPSSQTMRPFIVTDGSKVINRSSKGSFITETIENDAMLNVCIGMSFGMLYSFMEVEKLNRLLKQTESLVQDLEEELEMKDSLVMQELTVGDQKSPHNSEQSIDGNNKESVLIEKAKDEYFSEIEAELEAELEMLELTMSSSTLERRISNLVELDPDFEPGMAHGELRADMALDKSNKDNESATPCANYAVSPRELSLRLHEVLQSQLEQRIKELEEEIETKNTRIHNKSWKDFSSSEEMGDENINPDEPVVLNLSGEALDAYNEACNEFAKFDDDSDEDDDDGRTSINGGSEDEDDDEDEMERLLIKHIVEKARQGSPMVLNAQRALFSESNP